jgi:pyruvate, water dikinase
MKDGVWRRWLLPGVGLVLGGCGEPAAPDPVTLEVFTTEGAAVAEFLATVTFEDEQVETVGCPSKSQASTRLRCDGERLELLGAARPRELFVRSRGNAFHASKLEGAERRLTVRVEPLAEAEETPDYATRLDGADCLDQLRELSIPFASELGESFSVKFYIPSSEGAPRVYFQNTREHPLHFDFARNVLGVTGTADDFAAATYTGANRTAFAGTLVSYPSVRAGARGAATDVVAPWTLSFFPGDALSGDQARLVHRLVEERLTCLSWTGATERLVYVPATNEREAEAEADDGGFRRDGIGWMSRRELLGGLAFQALNRGVAYGTLQRLTPEELEKTPVSFRDVLLLPRLPNELPLVGGTITEELQTPLAHVNVAARSRGTPNLAYPGAGMDPDITSYLGQLVRFEVTSGGFTVTSATSDEARAFWEARTPARFVPTFDVERAGFPSFDEVGFGDWKSVGTKAANLAELTHFLGENAPRHGLAVPFHYYDQHLRASLTSAELCDAAEQSCARDGRSAEVCARARALCLPDSGPEPLGDWAARLLQTPAFNEDTALREASLASLRYGIEHSPLAEETGALLDERVGEVFGDAKVKLRSSTNTEDLPDFSGAGLYESHGAYAKGDRAASKVLAKVFASVWSFRAFEERAFWNIDHLAVRMGCAVNQAFVDELANGVLITQNIVDPATFGMYVNVQRGEASVTNPEGGALPEAFSILADADYQVARSRFSSLSPDEPILTRDEIKALYDAGALAQSHFSKLYGRSVVLDIEFKLTPEHRIVFKQARPYVAR